MYKNAPKPIIAFEIFDDDVIVEVIILLYICDYVPPAIMNSSVTVKY